MRDTYSMRTYKYQIRNHPKNKRLGNMLDDLADVHNYFLDLEKRYYRIYGKYAGQYRLQPHLTKLLKRAKKHWKGSQWQMANARNRTLESRMNCRSVL